MLPESTSTFGIVFIRSTLNKGTCMVRVALGSMPHVFPSNPCEDAISIEPKETVTKNPALTTFAPSQQLKSVGTVQLCENCPEWKKVKCRHSQNDLCRQEVDIVFASNTSTKQAAPAPVPCRKKTSRSDIMTNGRDEAIEPSRTPAGRRVPGLDKPEDNR